LHRPNPIGAADWLGWVQELCLYAPEKVDPAYQQLLAMHDPGEEPITTALLHAKVGEGSYVYQCLSLYRQLRELHPGALRLFVNLLAP
jgi:hypothetical protein